MKVARAAASCCSLVTEEGDGREMSRQSTHLQRYALTDLHTDRVFKASVSK